MPQFIYTALLILALPFVPLKLLWRGLRQPEYLRYWNERFGFYSAKIANPVIWLHCVSVGETRAAAPLINALQHEYPNHQILMTHGTPTGREASEQLFGDSVQRVYLPYDLPYAVNLFLAHFKPSIGLIMETELWFNLIAACKREQVPLLLLNARLSEKSAKSYANIGGLVKRGLGNLSAVAAQTEADAARLQGLGAQNISITGNLKFDVKPPADSIENGLAMRALLGAKRTVFLAASTREGEEALILDAVKGLNVLTVIVPRHPQRFDEVAALIEARDLKYIRRSNLSSQAKQHVPVVLGDTMGELFTYYAACDFAFVGGSLLKFGGQNLIEATSMGKPVLIGPHMFNFAAASASALQMGAAEQVNDAAELHEKILQLQQNSGKQQKMHDAARRFSQTHTGATEKLMLLIKNYIH